MSEDARMKHPKLPNDPITLVSRPLTTGSLRDRLLDRGFVEGPPDTFTKTEGNTRELFQFVDGGVKVSTDILCGIRVLEPVDVDTFFGKCHLCGEKDCDLETCAGCRQLYCDECGAWCHAEGDPDHGDNFCDACQIPPEEDDSE